MSCMVIQCLLEQYLNVGVYILLRFGLGLRVLARRDNLLKTGARMSDHGCPFRLQDALRSRGG